MTGARRAAGALVLAACLAAAVPASAQVWIGSSAPKAGTVEISGGGSIAAGRSFETDNVRLTGNPPDNSFDFFRSEPSLGIAPGAHAAVTVYITRALAIEGGFQYARPELRVRLTNDVEDAPDVTATTDISQYLFTGSLVYHFGRGGRTVPFIAGGGGHLRDAHDGNGLVETGTEFHGKAGVKMWFGRRGRVALRIDGGISVRDGGFSFEEGQWVVPTAAASIAYRF